MSQQKHETAPTRFVEASGISFAYRRFGDGEGLPLLFCQHFTGTMDNWDPLVTNTLAQGREVILFNNQGVGSSSGKTPDSVQAMSTDALVFVDALGLKHFDLLGFSIGGMIAQQMVLDRPKLVRRLILAGTGPEGGERIDLGLPPSSAVLPDASLSNFEKQLRLFFAPTETSQAAGRAYQERRGWRKSDVDPSVISSDVAKAQAIAIKSWGVPKGERYAKLKEIKQPALVFDGIDDVMIPTINSYILAQHLPDARLILYPDSGHGALFQYPDQFCAEAKLFLERQ